MYFFIHVWFLYLSVSIQFRYKKCYNCSCFVTTTRLIVWYLLLLRILFSSLYYLFCLYDKLSEIHLYTLSIKCHSRIDSDVVFCFVYSKCSCHSTYRSLKQGSKHWKYWYWLRERPFNFHEEGWYVFFKFLSQSFIENNILNWNMQNN